MSDLPNEEDRDRSGGGDSPPPARIGRYRIERTLGRGGFGIAYLAFDEVLGRFVALKVPRHLGSSSLAAYREEARNLAKLDHPNIVPIFDVKGDDDFPCYLVAKFIDGTDLTTKQGQGRMSHREVARIVATVAEALQHAHDKGIYHRDIKPANILLGKDGVPYIVDFGLALREEDHGIGSPNAGTPLYMSPEQARGEGHRVDGRSDVFSLGIVFCELLTGQRPFKGGGTQEVLESIVSDEARGPRMIDAKVPRELDQFCLRALARRASERYSRAADFAEDLRKWLEPLSIDPAPAASAVAPAPAKAPVPAGPAGNQTADAFISYASPDLEKAQQLCRLLEDRDVRCWMAPRDLQPGQDYGEAIIHAIESSPVLLLLLSAHSNQSVHVAHEVERAVSKRKRVVPVRLENVLPNHSLELHISSNHWVDAWEITPHELTTRLVRIFRAGAPRAPDAPASIKPPSSSDDLVPIDPKGPRSFEEEDANYYLRLLPGQRDRDGLPDGAKFWKLHIDSRDPSHAFKVGLIYGPSGCGKSSRVKAALLPRLAKAVVPVYLESSADETESRILDGLHRKLPALPEGIGLLEAMTAIRRGHYLPPGYKLTLFLDQFEQWLNANRAGDGAALVQALRQCDGVRLQCVLMIRDEFWQAVTRFMQALEIPIEEGKNARNVDLFDPKHGREVLILFGQAMKTLPEDRAAISRDQNAFLDQAVKDLSEDDKIVCVRLAIFAEMLKSKEWVPATLKSVGGIEGIGKAFLDENFNARHAPPQYRQHQEAAQRVLRSLLPPTGTDIKGHRRSAQELLAASEYAGETGQFDELIRILDVDLRLITPTDPLQVKKPGGPAVAEVVESYQLTHDYLVSSLREWLNKKNKETRRGRAELLLEERAAEWKERREHRHLPSLLQWASILLFVPAHRRTGDVQVRMVRRASRHYLTRIVVSLAALLALSVGGYEVWHRHESASLREQILEASATNVPAIVKKGRHYRPYLNPLLRQSLAETELRIETRDALVSHLSEKMKDNLSEEAKAEYAAQLEQAEKAARVDAGQMLNLSLALIADDTRQVEYLYARLLDSEPRIVVVLIAELEKHRGDLKGRLWGVAEDPSGDAQGRLRAAAALAKYDDKSPKWRLLGKPVVANLTSESPAYLGAWIEVFRSVQDHLITPLRESLKDSYHPRKQPEGGKADPAAPVANAQAIALVEAERAAKRNIASTILLSYLEKDAQTLADVLLDSDEAQFPKFASALRPHTESVLGFLRGEIKRKLPGDNDPQEKDRQAQRIANAGIYLLLTNNADAVWNLLRMSEEPSVRSYMISRLGRLGVDPKLIADQLAEPGQDVSVQRALVQALGGFPPGAFSTDWKGELIERIKVLYRESRDPGLHASAEWLLREWKAGEWVGDAVRNWSKDPRQRAEHKAIASSFTGFDGRPQPRWFVNGQGHTMVAIPGRIEFITGSPESEVGRSDSEHRRKKKIGRSFAISSTLTTIEQFDRFPDGKKHTENLPADFRSPASKPVVRADWFEAAKYCNWLSAQEGIDKGQWCYRTRDDGSVIGMNENYLELEGYRLPTDAEAAFANRAGTKTARYYGDSEQLLGEYAWYQKNSGDVARSEETTQPVGTKKPNDFGLFDMQGNAFTWCQDQVSNRLLDEDDVAPPEGEIDPKKKRVLRGGAFYFMAISLRAARRHDDVPTMQGLYYSFRVAKTLK